MKFQLSEKKVLKIGIGVISVILLFGTFNILSLSNTKSTLEDQFIGKQLLETNYLTENIEESISNLEGDLLTVSTISGIQTVDLSQQSGELAIIQSYLSTELSFLIRTDRFGKVVERSSSEIYKTPDQIINEDYFSIPRITKRAYISPIEVLNEEKVIIVSVPLFSSGAKAYLPSIEGEFQGVLISILPLEGLYSSFIFPTVIEHDSSYAIISSSGTPIYTDLSDEEITALDLQEEAFKVQRTTGTGTIVDNVVVTGASFEVGAEEYALFLITDKENIGGEFKRVQTNTLILFILLVLFLLGSIFVLYFMRSKPEVFVESDDHKAASTVALEPLELQILEQLKQAGLEKKAITFKDITKRCNITKPTTRTKMAQLIQKGLVVVEKRGRTKLVLLTKKGQKQL